MRYLSGQGRFHDVFIHQACGPLVRRMKCERNALFANLIDDQGDAIATVLTRRLHSIAPLSGPCL
jgi:hypothetical protein